MDELPEPRRRRIDAMSALMSLVTVAAMVGTAWLHWGPSTRREPAAPTLAVGAEAPALRLREIDSSEPMVLVGLPGKVVWVVFWSAEAPSGRACLRELARASKGLRAYRRFALVTAAAAAAGDHLARVRAVAAASGVDLPVYLAGPETLQRFAAGRADPPRHVLIDDDGRVLATARGGDRLTIRRVAEQALGRLEELDPLGPTRFAAEGGHRSGPPGGEAAAAAVGR